MIPVARTPEPPAFDERVRKPGRKWLETNAGAERPHPYWRVVSNDLRAAFAYRCASAKNITAMGRLSVLKLLSFHPKGCETGLSMIRVTDVAAL